ncbi:MAG: molecular chaperone HtpG [Candidatus Cloacimonetes bacterium]|nr:molecular chaperone HtpG [Candidatus Cloacimonadota bacterium]
MADKKIDKGSLSIHSENIFPIIKKWLYSEHDIFLRELIANAVDAMNKRKKIDPEVKDEDLKIEINIDKKKRTIEISDTGIGMTEDEIKKYINQIAFSGAEEFVEKYKDVQSNIIGHFGLGFYSSFMVSEKVTIDSLSYQKDSEAAHWECDGTTEYSMSPGKRKKVGTTVTLHLNKDSDEFLEDNKIRELLEKYCSFMPFSIEFDKKTVNQKEALWNKNPKDVKEEDYIEFYRNLFHEYEEPLFWIHLNVDYPFRLKGILYFPKIKSNLDLQRGKVKLFCNNVFVADNLKEFVPEFLLLLKGGIDVPDIPLNVSRSFLQNDSEVKKISKYLVKKVSDHFKETFNNDRKKYESYWQDIDQFFKYGVLTDEDFYEAVKDIIVFKSSTGDYVTVNEYIERNKSDEKTRKIYYAASENTQVSYIEMMKKEGFEVLYNSSPIDTHLLQHIESKLSDIQFVRVDSEINDILVDKENKEIADQNNWTVSDKIADIFDKVFNPEKEAIFSEKDYKDFLKKYPSAATVLQNNLVTAEKETKIKPFTLNRTQINEIGIEAYKELKNKAYSPVTVEIKSLKSENIPAMVVFNEHMRRFHEMNSVFNSGGYDMLNSHNLVINSTNPIVKKIAEMNDENRHDDVVLLCNYIHELALLEQKQFNGKELAGFIEKANKVMSLIK